MQVAGRELDEWLEYFTKKIKDKVKTDRIDEEIIDGIYEDERLPNYIWRIREERSERFVSLIPKTETVTPFAIRVSGPIGQWVDDPQSFAIDFLLNEIARLIIIREAITTLHSLLSEAKEFTSTETRLTKTDIKKASEWIRSNNHFADTLIIHPIQQIKLVEHQELIEAWRIRSLVGQKKRYFCGIIDALNTYWVSAIEKNVALIYEKHKCHLRRTPLRVRFDDPANPKQLIVEENRIAWFTDKAASAKIHFHSA